MSVPINRREFLFRRGRRALELSCERLFMKCLDAGRDGTTADLFASIRRQLEAADELRLVDTVWLSHQDLRQQLEPILGAFRARGGRIRIP